MKKTLLSIAVMLMISVLGVTSAFTSTTDANDYGVMLLSESADEKSDEEHSDEDHSDEDHSDEEHSDEDHDDSASTVTATAEDFNITTNDDNTVTFLRADGTIMANTSVTVKNNLTGEDGDISRDEYTTDENGVFDYSQFIEDDVYILRITDSVSSNTIEYIIETGEMTIEAGKSSNDHGDSSEATAETNSNMIIVGVAAIVVIAIAAVVIVILQKKKKAAFAAKAGKKVVKKK